MREGRKPAAGRRLSRRKSAKAKVVEYWTANEEKEKWEIGHEWKQKLGKQKKFITYLPNERPPPETESPPPEDASRVGKRERNEENKERSEEARPPQSNQPWLPPIKQRGEGRRWETVKKRGEGDEDDDLVWKGAAENLEKG